MTRRKTRRQNKKNHALAINGNQATSLANHASRSSSDSPRSNSQPAIMTAMSMHAGPLPPPGILAQYGQVRPDLPDVIVETFTSEVEHRRNNENKLVDSGIALSKRGQCLGFAVVLAVLGLAAFMVNHGMETAATVTVGIDVLGLASLFVLGGGARRRGAPPSAQAKPEPNRLPGAK